MSDTLLHHAAALHAMVPARLSQFTTISYPVWGTENGHRVLLYKKGRNDIYFVLFAALMFTVARHCVMTYLLSPIANYYIKVPLPPLRGIGDEAKQRRLRAHARKKAHAVGRFAEQGWSLLYCTLMETIGLTILSRIPNPTSPEQLWGTYPYTPIPWLTKFYYLVQLAWWFHQVYVLNTEKRRSDHWQMFFHHCITIALVSLSYMGNYTRVGTVVHTLMDFVDIILPAAKILRYLQFTTACDVAFGVFLLGWLATRQIGLAMVTYSAAVKAPQFIAFEWNPAKQHYLTRGVYLAFISLLSLLNILCNIWFVMALRVAVRVLRGEGAQDTRSDNEGEEEEETAPEKTPQRGVTNGHTTALNGRTDGYLNGHHTNGNGLSAGAGLANGNSLKRRS